MSTIAIIGSGISGLSCAHALHRRHQLQVFEAADYIGGHTHTVTVQEEGGAIPVDTGFIVCNDRTYPNFLRLLDGLGVARQESEMSFSVRNDDDDLEYNGGSWNGLFAQRGNLIRPRFWRLLADILRFNRAVRQEIDVDDGLTIGRYLEQGGYSPQFRENYLLPMVAAIWSMGLDSCEAFPLPFFARFFNNHGLLDIRNRPQWYTVKGGSSSYIAPLTAGFADRLHTRTPVRQVLREAEGVRVDTDQGSHHFDQVVFACHGDQALRLLARPTPAEEQLLGAFRCTDNRTVLHRDTSLLPSRRAAWASWNYRIAERQTTTLTYNMNILQRLPSRLDYLVSLNQEIDEGKTVATFNYRHPLYSREAVAAQGQWAEISGVDRLHFCGAYWLNGFHEDGVKSGLRVADMVEENR